MTIDLPEQPRAAQQPLLLNPPVRYRIPACRFLSIMDDESCRSKSTDLWPAEHEVATPDPDEPTTTPTPDFRPLSPVFDTLSQAKYHLQQQGFGSAHYVEILDDGRFQVVKRNLLVDKLAPILDQYGYLAVQSVVMRYRPVVESSEAAQSGEAAQIPVDPETETDPVSVSIPVEPDPDPENCPVPEITEIDMRPRTKKPKTPRDRREYHRQYRRDQKQAKLARKEETEMDTKDLIADKIEERKTDANPDGTGTPVVNDEIQVMVTDADKITGTDTGTNIITDPDVEPLVSDENTYGITPEKHTGSETVSDTVTPVVNDDIAHNTIPAEKTETKRDIDADALRSKGDADETPVTASQPVPDSKSEAAAEAVKAKPEVATSTPAPAAPAKAETKATTKKSK